MYAALLFGLLMAVPLSHPAAPMAGHRLERLQKAVQAIQDRGWAPSPAYRLRLAKAALKASQATGVDPYLLIGLARMESDFQPIQQINAPCMGNSYAARHQTRCFADCGATQHHLFGSWDYVTRMCRHLAQHPSASFLRSAKEIALHKVWCKQHHYDKNYWRCVLNRYNQGTFYRRTSLCFNRNRYMTHRGRWRCIARAIYWKKVLCFRYGAQHLLRPVVHGRDRCRYFFWRWAVQQIPTKVYRVKATPVRPKPAPAPVPNAPVSSR